MNAYLSSTAFWGTSTGLLGASTPSEWGNGGALALVLIAAVFAALGFAARALERKEEARREETARRTRKRFEQEERDVFCDSYLKNGGNSVIYATVYDEKREEEKRVDRYNLGTSRRRVEKRTNDSRRRQAEARRRAGCRVAFWTIVVLGFVSAAFLPTPDVSKENERVVSTVAGKAQADANRVADEPNVEMLKVADSEGSRWKSASTFQDVEDEWTETIVETAQETSTDENGEAGENKENVANEQDESAAVDVEEKRAALSCRAVSETVVKAQAPSGELMRVEEIRAESSLETAPASSLNATYSNGLRGETNGRASEENVVWRNRRVEAEGQNATLSGQVSQFAQPAQNLATAQSGQASQFAQPAQNLATAQSGQASQFAQPAQNLAAAQSGQVSQFAQSAQNLATAQSEPATQRRQETTSRDAAVPALYDESRERPIQNALQREFTPTAPVIPFPKEERVSQISSVGYETRGFENGASLLERIDAESLRIGDRVRKSVLSIETAKRSKTKATKNAVETGCGFLFQYKDKVYLATNAHVVKDATTNKNVKLFLPDKSAIHPAKIMPCGDFDLAALELDPATLPTDGSVALCYFGDSDELRVSNFVGTIGNPFGLRDTVTYGHVSSLQRRKNDFTSDGEQSLLEFFQIDASINPGNSGGPVYNARGEVVGVVSAIATTTGKSEGVAFAIPINLALNVLKSTIDGGGWSRSRMGVELETASRADFQGVVDWPIKSGSKIVGVDANSPAERAGLRGGDVVVEFNGEAIEDDVHFARLIAIADVSRDSSVKFLRGAQLLQTSARLERSALK